MTKSSAISVRIDPTLKQDAERVFNDLGLTASQAIALFYRQVALQQGIPFSLHLPPNAKKNGGADTSVTADHSSDFYQSPERAQLLREQQAYEAMHVELWTNYPHQFVADCDWRSAMQVNAWF